MACENHTAIIYDRGGETRFMEITPVDSIDWQRLADDVSMANVSFDARRCGFDVGLVEAARHELVIFRGLRRVWEGPITLIEYEGDQVSLQARDVMHYANRTIMRRTYNNAYPNVDTCINRAMDILTTELNRQWERIDPPINVVPYLTPIRAPGDARTSRKTDPYAKTVFEELDDLAARSGLDYAAVGRRIIIHDTHTALGRTPTLSEADLIGPIRITQYGMETAAFAAVTGQERQVGTAEGVNGFPDPYYGAWEILDDAYDEEAGTDAPTQAELDSQAERNVRDRIPTPVEVRVPDNSTLAVTSPLYDVDLLIPGIAIPVLARFPARELTQMQKLRSVKWTESEKGETVQITLSSTTAELVEEAEA